MSTMTEIDRLDLDATFAARNQDASGPDDPQDADSTGRITIADNDP